MSTGRAVLYGLANLAYFLGYSAFNTYVLFFYTEHLRLSPSAVGRAWFLFGIWNTVNDLAMGWLSDRTATRKGRTFFLILFAVPLGLAFAFVWSPPGFVLRSGPTVTLAYFLIVISLYDVLQTAVNISQHAAFPEIASGRDDRSRTSAVRQALGIVGTILGVAVSPLLYAHLGWMWLGILWGAAITGFNLLSLPGFRSPVRSSSDVGEPQSEAQPLPPELSTGTVPEGSDTQYAIHNAESGPDLSQPNPPLDPHLHASRITDYASDITDHGPTRSDTQYAIRNTESSPDLGQPNPPPAPDHYALRITHHAPNPEHPNTEHPNTRTPNTEHPSTEHPNTEHPNTEHPNTPIPNTRTPEHPNTEHRTPQSRTPEHPNTEHPNTEHPNTEHPNTHPPLLAPLLNPTFLLYVGIQFSIRLALAFLQALLPFFSRHVLGLTPNQLSLAMGVMLVSAALSAALWPRVLARREVRTVAIAALAYLAVLVTSFLGVRDFRLLLGIMLLVGPVYAGLVMTLDLLFAQIVDQDFARTGESRAGFFSGLVGTTLRFSPALAGLVIGEVLGASGFDPALPSQPGAVSAALRLLMTIGPAAALLLAVGFLVFYPLHGRRLVEIEAAVQRRKGA